MWIQLATLQMVTFGRKFQELVWHVKGVKQDFFVKSVGKKARKGDSFSGSFIKGSVPLIPAS